MRLRKTESGQAAFAARSPLLNPRQRAVFLLCDGAKPVADVLASTSGLGATDADIRHLLDNGLLEAVEAAEPMASEPDVLVMPLDDKTRQERYLAAKPMATQLSASLGLRGFRLNLAIEAAAGYDELLALLPRIQESVGRRACKDLERALKG